MKRFSITITAAIIATLVLSMLVLETVTTEASSNATPNATPRKRSTQPAKVKVAKPRSTGVINGMDDWVRRPGNGAINGDDDWVRRTSRKASNSNSSFKAPKVKAKKTRRPKSN